MSVTSGPEAEHGPGDAETSETRAHINVLVRRVAEPFEMEAESESGWKVRIDSGKAGGGPGNGVRPNELLVMALAGCSGIDIVSILSKQRQVVERFDVQLNAWRDYDQVPAVIVAIHAHYIFEGEIDPDKARRAIDLSLDKYCSVSAVLRKTAGITFSFSINGERYE